MSQVQTDWLESSIPADATPSAAPAVAEADWLDGKIEAMRSVMPYDPVRFLCMKGTGRVWACDGEFVACRPNAFHEGTNNRHQNFLASGHYKHLGTFDDVQIFELLPGSPFRRDNRTLIPGVNIYQDMRECAKAAVTRDWVLYNDILEEIAKNIKERFDVGTAKQIFDDTLQQIFTNIAMRGGPTQAEVDAGLARIRMRRGVGKGKVIALPSARTQ